MKLAHVSDLHLQPPGAESGIIGPTSHDIASAIVDDLIAIARGLDLIVVSGDLTEKADAASFIAFERMFSRIGIPIVVVPGNHDGPTAMRNYARQSSFLAHWDISKRAVEIGGMRLLGLDTCLENLTSGALGVDALALVETEIARQSEAPLILVMHHPPLLLGLKTFDGFCELDRGDELLRILKKTKKDILILSGHVHRPYSARKWNLSCHVAGSMVAPYDSALPFGDDPIRPAALQDFYFIHEIDAGGRHVVTPQRVRILAPDNARPAGESA